MRVLAIDCSTEWLTVAVGDEATCVERREAAGHTHSERVLPLVNAVLDECGIAIADLDGIAFGAGPGSFTGVRIACGIAQGLALGATLPVVPVGTLLAMAHQASRVHGEQRVISCLDARMREVYIAAYRRESSAWHEVLAPIVAKPDEIVELFGSWFGAGPGFAAYPKLADGLSVRAIDATIAPMARAIVELALPRLAAGDYVDAARALPLYVRHRVALTSAERAAGARL